MATQRKYNFEAPSGVNSHGVRYGIELPPHAPVIDRMDPATDILCFAEANHLCIVEIVGEQREINGSRCVEVTLNDQPMIIRTELINGRVMVYDKDRDSFQAYGAAVNWLKLSTKESLDAPNKTSESGVMRAIRHVTDNLLGGSSEVKKPGRWE